MEEIWKDIEGYEGRYQVSNLGRVKALPRVVSGHNQHGKWTRTEPEQIMGQKLQNTDRLQVCLRDANGKRKTFYVHRLVATAFVPNPDDKPYINHKDENRSNNVPENLEWCTMEENNLYGGHVERTQSANIANRQAIEQVDASGNVVATFESIKSAAHQTGIPISSVSQCLSGKLRQTHGFTFRRK